MEALDYREKSRIAFDAQAATYDMSEKGAHARGLYGHVADALVEAGLGVGGAPDVLDLGCGTGALALRLLDLVPACRIVGVDISPNMVKRARAAVDGRADIVEADSASLPFHDESFDFAFCNDSFHHYPDPERAVFETWRVLRPGGAFVIGDCALPSVSRAVMNAFIRFSHEGDVRIYSEDEFKQMLGVWFTRVEWRRIGSASCLVQAVK